MNTQIDKLIRLNIELEGALRVAKERPRAEVMEVVKEKFASMSALFATLTPAAAISEQRQENTDLKIQEAEGAEEAPLEEPDLSQVPDEVTDITTVLDAPGEPQAPNIKPDFKKMMSVNDRFLFRRELFSNSDSEMADTLDMIASMHSLAEAEEYFYHDLQWDAENPTVKDFMTIVKACFG